MKKIFEIEVAENWIEDGFDLDSDRVKNGMSHELPYAYAHEYSVREIPDHTELLKETLELVNDLAMAWMWMVPLTASNRIEMLKRTDDFSKRLQEAVK